MTFYRAEIEDAAKARGLNPDLVEALVLVESSGHADAFRYEPGFYDRYLKTNPEYVGQQPRRVSSSYGLMQLMFSSAKELGFTGEPEALFVPDVNLRWGCQLLQSLILWADGDLRKALGAYNAGRGGWASATAQAYAAKVLGWLTVLHGARGTHVG